MSNQCQNSIQNMQVSTKNLFQNPQILAPSQIEHEFRNHQKLNQLPSQKQQNLTQNQMQKSQTHLQRQQPPSETSQVCIQSQWVPFKIHKYHCKFCMYLFSISQNLLKMNKYLFKLNELSIQIHLQVIHGQCLSNKFPNSPVSTTGKYSVHNPPTQQVTLQLGNKIKQVLYMFS